MPPPRFFCETPLAAGGRIELPAALAHHAQRVLRLADGTPIVLFDGLGGQYPAVLRIEGRRTLAELGAHAAIDCELRGQLVLIQGLASGDKMDWVVEKAVELGISELWPVAAERSVLRLSGPRLEKRLDHWRAIVRAASEQCGRNRLMVVHPPAPLAHCLDTVHGPALFCHPEGPLDFRMALDNVHDRLTLMVGPEGGWSPDELALAQRKGLIGTRFGPRVLRTETAGLALASAATVLLDW
ncbi:MAG: 16S rRNA (uracil(1498)-N(3))-methyltransferase [Castellaniella sp.]|uniref:16S rRNA (uracil(1498)-N(3))-methyltransferase n=1 Tax=Castellaniella sp. TaxID=1955812 RepID=UPI002A372699|nr:16S rRNA (uracil(1498)-N(3))-methyltransferase [Castellaniella sp.]MDY0308879.1 16S rRNA (uracil(1498)-N(3))-methyltransferase [Castellaniella sp.]